jgi:transcriptional regulator with XRE-family HTH domain
MAGTKSKTLKTQRRRNPAPKREVDRAVGTRIRQLRLAKAMSAAALGAPYYTRAHVSALELGKIGASLHALAHFAKQLGVPLRELIPPDL